MLFLQAPNVGKLAQGMVRKILTQFPTPPHGIKVQPENGLVGRVKIIP
ncbi:MAG: DUF2196 domain-containing protein [Desulfobacteraceae bacterium]|nr:DUF2196 domain-containing protein [Desulfobacteraceae bacterium]MBU4001771.1 DUF2196 domain-containing protein [Pseudomonadota bacterium]MBU4055712.1 DUF2196 domain-containing protein [Pseudomonadota bacterium]